MIAVLSILKAVPIWAYALAAAVAWGGIQHKRATWAGEREKVAMATAAAEEAKALRATIAESARRAVAHQEIASAAKAQSETNARAAAAARAAADRVRSAASAYAASATAASAAAGGDCKAAEAASNLLAQLLGRATDRAAILADLADQSRTAGQACEQAYDELNQTRPRR